MNNNTHGVVTRYVEVYYTVGTGTQPIYTVCGDCGQDDCRYLHVSVTKRPEERGKALNKDLFF